MPINKNELTKEMIEKAMQCETAEDLMALAKAEGMELSKEEAEAYLNKLEDIELDGDSLKHVAGGLGDEREDMNRERMPEAFMRGEITGGEDF
jgi:hypothetical protein